MQVLEGERILQIEKYVNVKIDEALQEVQDTRREIESQTDGVRQLLNEFKHAVANNQDSVVAHIRQVVEEKLATLHLNSCGQDATQVHRMVEDAVTAALAGSTVMFNADLQRMRSEIHQEVKAKIDEPVRCLVKELTTQEVRQLESRLQTAVTTAQSELNLQMQRQADATSVLYSDKLRKQQVRSKHQSERVDPTKLKTSIREVLRSNPDLVGPGQVEHQTSTNGTEPKTFDQINATIERSVGSAASITERSVGAAAATIGNAISGGLRGLSRSSSTKNHCNSSDSDDEVMDEEDRQLEKWVQDAWRKHYHCGKTGKSDAGNDCKNAQSDKEEEKSVVPPPLDVISKQLDSFPQTELPIEAVTTTNRNFRYGAGFQSGVLFVVPPSSPQTGILVRQHTHPTLSDQEVLASVPLSPLHQMQNRGNELLRLRRVQSRNNEKRNPSVRPQIQSMEQIQSPSPLRPRKVQNQSKPARSRPRLNGQLQSKPAWSNDIQQVVEGLQRQMARRAELAARRYSAKK